MNSFTFIRRSLWHYRRTALGVLLGTAVSTAVLTGALMVGDAVQGSLEQRVHERLGRVAFAISMGDTFATDALAEDLAKALNINTAALLTLPGSITLPDDSARANHISVHGVDRTFFALSPDGRQPDPLPHDGVALNSRLANHLGAHIGDSVIIRVDTPGTISRDLPVGTPDESATALRLKVSQILHPEAFGHFSLRAEQTLPMNAFIARDMLTEKLDAVGQANLILAANATSPALAADVAATHKADRTLTPKSVLNSATIKDALRSVWTPEDAGLSLHPLDDGSLELRSQRVFLEDRVVQAAHQASDEANTVLTYFVNTIDATTNATPYSFVAGIENASLTDNMPDDGIVVNHWLADDLQLSPGDAVELHYYAINAQNRLTETNHAFHVHAIVRITGEANDPSLMPAFPGLLDVDNCRDWDPGMPLDLKRVRDKDEAYWDNHRGTPKAFVTLPAARTMWSNRHGTATGVRFPYQADASVDLLADILMRLHPGDVGMRILPVLETGLRASRDGVSFGQLFIGLSFFLIVAALLLTGLLFAFGIEQRAEETGLLLALGMRAQAILRIRLLEGSCIAVPGALLGGALGILCNALVLQLLSGAWQTIVGTIPLQLRVLPTTLITGTACGALSAWIAMWLTARKQCIREPATLQRAAGRKTRCSRQSRTIALGFGVLCWGAVATIVFASGLHTAGGAAGIFFGAGAMALTGSLAITYAALDWIGARQTHGEFGLLDVALRGATRRPLHSLATVGLLATGAFLVIATGANRPGPPHDASDPASGTGGFELFAESSIPIFENLQTPSGRKTLGIGPDLDIEILPLRCFEGDDASCLNLNRVTQPTVLGVAPEALVGRFAFAGILSELATDHPWDALDAPVQSNVIPAVADQSTVLWGLGKKLGDGLPVEDGRGNPVELQFLVGTANSVLQGYVLISESNFVTRFPYTAGYRIFLIDVNSGTPQVVAQELSRLLANYGFEITPTPARLAAFAAIQDTYLSIFMSLGALALLLGSAGVGVVVARNIMERRAELAMLGALGFARRTLYLILLIEHTALFTIGLAAGSAAGWVAVLHALKSQGTPVSLAALAGLLALLLANGLLWITTAVALATRGPLLPALRQE